jgi:putative hemolysin
MVHLPGRPEETWTWREGAWRRADPQPEHDGYALKGTACLERGHCELRGLRRCTLVCEDCGSTTHVVPDGYTFEEWERAQYEYLPRPLTQPDAD